MSFKSSYNIAMSVPKNTSCSAGGIFCRETLFHLYYRWVRVVLAPDHMKAVDASSWATSYTITNRHEEEIKSILLQNLDTVCVSTFSFEGTETLSVVNKWLKFFDSFQRESDPYFNVTCITEIDEDSCNELRIHVKYPLYMTPIVLTLIPLLPRLFYEVLEIAEGQLYTQGESPFSVLLSYIADLGMGDLPSSLARYTLSVWKLLIAGRISPVFLRNYFLRGIVIDGLRDGRFLQQLFEHLQLSEKEFPEHPYMTGCACTSCMEAESGIICSDCENWLDECSCSEDDSYDDYD